MKRASENTTASHRRPAAPDRGKGSKGVFPIHRRRRNGSISQTLPPDNLTDEIWIQIASVRAVLYRRHQAMPKPTNRLLQNSFPLLAENAGRQFLPAQFLSARRCKSGRASFRICALNPWRCVQENWPSDRRRVFSSRG